MKNGDHQSTLPASLDLVERTVRDALRARGVEAHLAIREIHPPSKDAAVVIVDGGDEWYLDTGTYEHLTLGADAMAESIAARATLAPPAPCPTCKEYPLTCEFHGAANAAAAKAEDGPSGCRCSRTGDARCGCCELEADINVRGWSPWERRNDHVDSTIQVPVAGVTMPSSCMDVAVHVSCVTGRWPLAVTHRGSNVVNIKLFQNRSKVLRVDDLERYRKGLAIIAERERAPETW